MLAVEEAEGGDVVADERVGTLDSTPRVERTMFAGITTVVVSTVYSKAVGIVEANSKREFCARAMLENNIRAQQAGRSIAMST